MILHIPALLSPAQVAHCREVLATAEWIDGAVTAGEQSARAKRNLQVSEEASQARALGEMILEALRRNPAFLSAALPLKVFPPLFNRYGEGMGFDDHIDNAIRHSATTGGSYRTDLSCTLFLNDPDAYDGGELVIADSLAPRRVKLPAGDLILYPAVHVHRVEPITRGERWAAFFWVQSMIADPTRRTLLYDLDQAIALTRRELGDDHAAAISLTGTYHNLVRLWSQI